MERDIVRYSNMVQRADMMSPLYKPTLTTVKNCEYTPPFSYGWLGFVAIVGVIGIIAIYFRDTESPQATD